jgi:hypothetical protein
MKKFLPLAILTALALVFGMVGFAQYYAAQSESYTLTDTLYGTLQLFTLNAGFASGTLPVTLDMARFLAPAVMVYVVVLTIFALGKKHLALLFIRRHTVVCGLGSLGRMLARDYRVHGANVIAIDRAVTEEMRSFCADHGILLLDKEINDVEDLQAARLHLAERLVIACGDDAVNLSVLMNATSSVDGRSASSPLDCLIQIRDLHACAAHFALNTLKPKGMALNYIDPDLTLAHKVLERYPLDYERIAENDPRQVHLMLIGFSRAAEKMLLAAAYTAHCANGLLPRISIFNAKPEVQQQFEGRYHYADKAAEIHFAPFPLESRKGSKLLLEWAEDKRFLTTLAFFSEPTSLAMQQVLGLQPELKGAYPQKLLYLRAQNWQKPLLQFLEGGLHLHPFGIEIGELNMDVLAYAPLAQALHEEYRTGYFKKEPQGTSSAALPWNDLSIEYKQSSFSQAAHFLVKVRAIGCELREGVTSDTVELSEHEVECLARMEHARWVAERSLSGWRYDKVRDNTLLRHDNLVAYDELDEGTKGYDCDFVRKLSEYARLLGKTLARCG